MSLPQNKKILYIDLTKKVSELKTSPDLYKYIGGVALGLRIYELHQELDPLIFSVGPLNGMFPYASKTCIISKNQKEIEDFYLGGYFGSRLKFSDIDALVIYGKSKDPIYLEIKNSDVTFIEEAPEEKSMGLPGKRSYIETKDGNILADDYFETKDNTLQYKMEKMGIRGISITTTKSYNILNPENYLELHKEIMQRSGELKVERGFFPSCAGCPMGCEQSKIGEVGGNVLVHSMVGCEFAENIYADIGTVFSCLNTLGYTYTHEDLENLQVLVQNSLKNISL